MSEKQFRNKVCFAAFFFSLMVVMIHSYNADMFLTLPASSPGGRAVWAFEHILADVLGPVAVPGFFMISAYQFYRNCSFQDVVPKMERRIRTVLIPYLLWNFFYYAGYALAGKIPFLAGLSDKTAVEFSIPVMAEAVLHFTYNPVFWYMYQLIFLIALSPVLYPLLKNRVAGLAALLLELYCIKNLVNLPVINMDALFYYSAAAYGALHGSWLVEESWKKERTDRKKTETERIERIRRLEPWLRLLTAAGDRSGRLLLSGNHSQAFCAGNGAVPFYSSRHDLGGGIRNQASGGQRVDEIRFFPLYNSLYSGQRNEQSGGNAPSPYGGSGPSGIPGNPGCLCDHSLEAGSLPEKAYRAVLASDQRRQVKGHRKRKACSGIQRS